jgi:simple sugar transport system permease protein
MTPLWRSLRALAAPAAAILAALLAGAVIMTASGASPLKVYAALVQGTLGNAGGAGEVIYRATQLIFTGLAVALPFRAGLFNIGGEGQLAIGGLATALVAAASGALPPVLQITLALAAGAIAGGLWGGIAGVLKARTGGHEVINTIMLNFIGIGAINYLLADRLGLPGTMRTGPISTGAHLPPLARLFPGLEGSPANASLLLALALAALLAIFLRYTAAGLETRAVGANALAARIARLPEQRVLIAALVMGGALAGLSGANTVLGNKQCFEEGLGAGSGFQGIAVALLARNHPVGILPVALFFGVLSYGGLVVNAIVPREIVQILQALALVALLIAGGMTQLLARRPRAASAGRP